MSEQKKGIGQRGPDKQPRKHGGGRPEKADEDRATFPATARLTAAEMAQVKKLFGNTKNALLWAIEHHPKQEDITTKNKV